MKKFAAYLLLFGVFISNTIKAAEEGPRLYVFDCGLLSYDDISAFGLSNDETPVRDLFVPCYLIEHLGKRLIWDFGLPTDVVGEGVINYSSNGRMYYETSLLEQLATMGLSAADIDFIAPSHMHFDHAGSMNLFTESTILMQAVEYEAIDFEAEQPPHYEGIFDGLDQMNRQLLQGDHDVFGDGKVIIISAPGHTIGHQVLLIRLEEYGPLLLSGDLYHFRKTRELRRTPVFNYDGAMTLESMDRIENILLEENATLWIEHDQINASSLRKAPEYYQ